MAAVLSARAQGAASQGLPLPGTPAASSLAGNALAEARDAFARGDWSAAEGLLRNDLRAHPDAPDALYLLGSALFHEGKARASLTTFTAAARFQPPTALQLRIVAMDYVLLDDYPDADRWISRSLQQDPRDGESWYTLGRVRQTENRFADAVAAFHKALALMPRSVKAEDNLGLALEGLNQPDQAMAAYREALAWQSSDPHPSAQPFLDLGILLTNRNQTADALPLLQRAAVLAPGDVRAHTSLGRLYARLQDYPRAEAELELAVAAKPDDASLHFQLGQVYRKQGQAARGAAELQRAAALEASNRR